MKNITKMLLSSAILATGTMAGEVMDVHQDIQNNGTINIVPDMKIKVEAGRWIINKGTINFMKPLNGDGSEAKFTISGSDDNSPSGIKNKGPEFAAIEGKPTAEGAPIDNATYFNLNNLGGTIQVKDPDNSGNTRQLNANDYKGETGGIIQMEKDGLYNFLKEGDHNNGNNVIVLRGKHDVPNNMILLDHNDSDNKTTESEPLDITNTFVNADIYETFQKDEEDPVEFAQSYALGVNGFFRFLGTNTNFNREKVEFMDGSSEFNSLKSMFGTKDLTISGGNVNIKMTSNDTSVVLSDKTINVTSHKDAETGDDVYGCLVVTSGDVTLDKDSVLNLGYKAE